MIIKINNDWTYDNLFEQK